MNVSRREDCEHRRLRRSFCWFGLLLLGLLGLALAWGFGPFHEWLDPGVVLRSLRQFGQTMGPVIGITIFALACTIAIPISLLTLVSMIVFGSLAGTVFALIGGIIGSAISYGIGHYLGREAVYKLAGKRINGISERLARRGILSVIVLRFIPMAPFAIFNMIVGASAIRMRDFLIGSTIGMLPSTLFIALSADILTARLMS